MYAEKHRTRPFWLEEEEEHTIASLLKHAASYAAKQEYEAARILYTRAASTSMRGKLELARFLMNTAKLDMKQIDRFRKSEALLLELECSENKLRASEACVLLGELYTRVRKPISAFGYMVRQKILKGKVDEQEILSIVEAVQKTAIHAGIEDPHGCYVLGWSLAEINNEELAARAQYFLQLAVEHGGDAMYVGLAALRLAELLDTGEYNRDNRHLVLFYQNIAAAHGNPDVAC